MHICENNTIQFSAKIISKVQSRGSSQVLSICSLSASWLNCYIFSCPLKILPFGANNHQNQLFELFARTTPCQAFLKEKLVLFLSLAKTWFWAFFAPKVEIATFFKVLNLTLHFKSTTSLSPRKVFWKVFATLINFVHRLEDLYKYCIIRAKRLLGMCHGSSIKFWKNWIFPAGFSFENKPSGTQKRSQKAISTPQLACASKTHSSKIWAFFVHFFTFSGNKWPQDKCTLQVRLWFWKWPFWTGTIKS